MHIHVQTFTQMHTYNMVIRQVVICFKAFTQIRMKIGGNHLKQCKYVRI